MTKAKAILPPGEDAKAKKPRLKKSDNANATESQKTFIGQEVHGIVDGSFDAGYLLTVKVGDLPLVFRGLVFEPGMLAPLSKSNDIAPTIQAKTRDQQVALHMSGKVPMAVNGSSPTTREGTRGVDRQGPLHSKEDDRLSNLTRISALEQGSTEPSYSAEDFTANTSKDTDDLGNLEVNRTEQIHPDEITDSRNDLPATHFSSMSRDVEMPESVTDT
ncbi:hypothetical protein L7F22_052529 [Adiantum nelumboides]|nr:hypothetical protein [Adiantum nelumboides]